MKPFETYLSSASSHILYMLPTSFFNCLWRSSLNVQSSASIEVPTPFDVDTSLIVIVEDSSVDSSAEVTFSSLFPFSLWYDGETFAFSEMDLFDVVSICLRLSCLVSQLWTDAFKRNIDDRYVCNCAFSSWKYKNSNWEIKLNRKFTRNRIIQIGFEQKSHQKISKWLNYWLVAPLSNWNLFICIWKFSIYHWR